jgi:peptidoglycan/LPS O-acetylase OafA/YrhL
VGGDSLTRLGKDQPAEGREILPHDRDGRYRPELDGLRAIAIILVLAFHCDLSLALGGYVGVDVFFVLSGFLITGLLLDAANDPAARGVDMLRFYARRARRLLPMALLVIVCISAAWLLTANAIDRAPLVADGRSAALYFSNWHFAATATDYFASQNAPSPFVHFWSLSVEEQFYLVWPAIIALIYWWCSGRRQRAQTLVGVVAVVLMAGSLAALAVTTADGDSSYAYFGTHTRAYQLLAGAALAVVLRRRTDATQPQAPARDTSLPAWTVLQVASLAALLLVATREIDLGPGMRGVVACICTVVLLVGLTAAPRGLVRRLLSLPAVVYLGQISYAAYLWHWPVILLIRRFVVISPHLLLIPAFALSFGLAALSQRLVERPIRVSPLLARFGRSSIAAGLALSLLVGLLVAPAMLESTRRPAITALANTTDSTSTSAALPKPEPSGGKRTPVPSIAAIKEAARSHPLGGPACIHRTGILCHAYTGGPRTMMVVGDSHLEAFLPVFIDIAKRNNVSLYTWMSYVCPWERGVLPAPSGGDSAQSDSCRGAQNDLYGTAMASVKPDVTVVLNRGYDDPNFPRPLFIDGNTGNTDAGPVLALAMPNAVQSVLALSKRLIVVEPWPSLTQSQPSCLAEARFQEQCVMSAAIGKLPEETALEAVAAKNPQVGVVDLDRDVCPRLPACDPVVKGQIVRRDQDHVSITFAAALTTVLADKLRKAGGFGSP